MFRQANAPNARQLPKTLCQSFVLCSFGSSLNSNTPAPTSEQANDRATGNELLRHLSFTQLSVAEGKQAGRSPSQGDIKIIEFIVLLPIVTKHLALLFSTPPNILFGFYESLLV